jgi:hypothetical protein
LPVEYFSGSTVAVGGEEDDGAAATGQEGIWGREKRGGERDGSVGHEQGKDIKVDMYTLAAIERRRCTKYRVLEAK